MKFTKKCKDHANHRELGKWLTSTKERRRQCLTGYNCLGDWVEKQKCSRNDFTQSRRIETCPCEFEQDYLDKDRLIDLIKSFERLQVGDELVANPINCHPNQTYYEEMTITKYEKRHCEVDACKILRKSYR